MIDQPLSLPPRLKYAHRLVQICLGLSLVWKIQLFEQFDGIYRDYPLSDAFFPDWLESVWTLRVALLGTLAAITWNVVTKSQRVRIGCCAVSLAGISTLCIHQGSYNDATFVTGWWTSLWAIWFAHRMGSEDTVETTIRRAAMLSRLIISMILLGGAVGKWTPEYWSGEVLYEIYFRDRQFWAFNLVRQIFNADSLRTISMWYSRQVVIVETVAGLGLWLLPPRWAASASVAILSSIALFSNFNLFSVLLSLIGLGAVGFFVPKISVDQ